MAVRRVVTGHTPEGKAVIASDGEVASMLIGERGSATTVLWGRDDPGRFPDDGSQPGFSSSFSPPGGCRAAVMELAPEGDDFHEFVRDGLAQWADPDDSGMHRTPTLDYDIVLEGIVGLELDDGVEVTLGPGDFVVLNGTRHRWHNRGDSIAHVFAVPVGAYHEIDGGRPVGPLTAWIKSAPECPVRPSCAGMHLRDACARQLPKTARSPLAPNGSSGASDTERRSPTVTQAGEVATTGARVPLGPTFGAPRGSVATQPGGSCRSRCRSRPRCGHRHAPPEQPSSVLRRGTAGSGSQV